MYTTLRLACCLLPFLSGTTLCGQLLTPTVIGSSGNHYSSANIQVSSTIGEVLITTISNSSNILTQGFHQLESTNTNAQSHILHAYEPRVFPNPTADILTINVAHTDKAYQLVLYDILGQIISTGNICCGQSQGQIDLKNLPNASYILCLTTTPHEKQFTFLVEKKN